ncbi:MAG: hypothetical protein FWF20_10525 [Betaproteobacteria bacterium]|nr:hypothetical protein [Betaproteobacteria bacterium]MCL2887190.1 hypothetical protein [Betaproteobacteria bacterium]
MFESLENLQDEVQEALERIEDLKEEVNNYLSAVQEVDDQFERNFIEKYDKDVPSLDNFPYGEERVRVEESLGELQKAGGFLNSVEETIQKSRGFLNSVEGVIKNVRDTIDGLKPVPEQNYGDTGLR